VNVKFARISESSAGTILSICYRGLIHFFQDNVAMCLSRYKPHFRFVGLFANDKAGAREECESIKAIYRSNSSLAESHPPERFSRHLFVASGFKEREEKRKKVGTVSQGIAMCRNRNLIKIKGRSASPPFKEIKTPRDRYSRLVIQKSQK